MLIPIVVTIALIILVILIYLIRKPTQSRICFVGPHCSGKTSAMLSLAGIPNKTVTTLADHQIVFKNKEILEIVPDDSTNDFIKKFRLSEGETYVFFVKNEEEFESFPDLSGFKIIFVLWQKEDEKTGKNLTYLDESKEKLAQLLSSL